jgi:hypothetical protein
MTCFGPDGSYHQFGGRDGESKPWSWLLLQEEDWAAIEFVLWRASIAARTDWSFPRMRDETMQRGKAFAAYHFVYPVVRYPARAQVDALMRSLDGNTDIPVWLDWEHDGETVIPQWSDVIAFADAARDRGLRVPGVYTGGWYWSGYAGSPTLAGYGLDLWLSDYGNQQPTSQFEIVSRYAERGGDESTRWNRNLGGLTPVLFQYGSRIRWGNRYMDMNAHRGPVAELGRWFWTKPAPPIPVEEPEVITPEDRGLIVADVMAAIAPQLAALATKNDWKTKLDTDPSGVPWPADVMLGWLRRDVVSLKLGLLGEAQAGTIAQIAEAVAARVDSEVSAEDLARELIAQLAG